MEYLWSQWYIIAFFAPFFWAIMNVIDAYFVSSVYEDEWDGGIISSLFQLVPWLLVIFGFVEFFVLPFGPAIVAIVSGAFFSLSFFFYFRTLFSSHDVVVIGAIWNLSVPLVPFLAWLLVGERLTIVNYFGIAIAFIGAMLFTVHERIRARNLGSVFKNMLLAVSLLSFSMVLQSWVYDYTQVDFWSGFLLFSCGSVMAGGLMIVTDKRTWRNRATHLLDLTKRNFHVFFFAELLGLTAILCSQRAINLSPAVSFVAAIESTVPIFVMVISFVLSLLFMKTNHEKARQLFVDQLDAFGIKILACLLIAFGIYLIS